MNGFRIIIPISPYITDGIAARSSTADDTMLPSLLPASSERKTAVRRPTGTPISIAAAVPTIEDNIMNSIPYDGLAAVGAHSVPKSRSGTPISLRAGVPLLNM